MNLEGLIDEVTVVIGAQWGDEGKGKIVDFLSGYFDIVVRYQGGNNAGHTVVHKKEIIMHSIPSGIINGKICVIGNGCVINPIELRKEIELLEYMGIDVKNKLKISDKAHLIMPWHIEMDKLNDKKQRIGTTKKGIGPTYSDKYARRGIRIGDLCNSKYNLNKILKENYFLYKDLFKKRYGFDYTLDIYEYDNLIEAIEFISNFVINTELYLNEEIDAGKKVLLEGAQGTMLDIDFGTYPNVTSSNPTVGGSITGTGINPKKIKKVIGVAKAYVTRVGNGPFPTEIKGELAQLIRDKGKEYGATTGRPRRIGFFDCNLIRYGKIINGYDYIIITKLDVLSNFPVKVSKSYIVNEKEEFYMPIKLDNVKPNYIMLNDWEDINNVKSFNDLPKEARKYIETIEDLCNVKVKMISTSPKKEDIIILN